MKQFNSWCRLLLALCALQALLGIALVVINTGAFPGAFNEALNQTFWGEKQLPANVVAYSRFANGVLGATIAAWSVTMAFVAHYPFRAREPWAWTCVALSVAVWCVLDTGCSIYLGVWPNAVLNLVCVVPFVVILAFTRREFAG